MRAGRLREDQKPSRQRRQRHQRQPRRLAAPSRHRRSAQEQTTEMETSEWQHAPRTCTQSCKQQLRHSQTQRSRTRNAKKTRAAKRRRHHRSRIQGSAIRQATPRERTAHESTRSLLHTVHTTHAHDHGTQEAHDLRAPCATVPCTRIYLKQRARPPPIHRPREQRSRRRQRLDSEPSRRRTQAQSRSPHQD